MNNVILMAEIIQEPELRYTSENQTPITEMLVQFPGLRADDPLATLKVVGWGNLAQEIQANYHQGDRVVIEGRLGMNTIDRPEGFKEKRAELTAQRLHRLTGEGMASTTPLAQSAPTPTNRATSTRGGSDKAPRAKTPTGQFAATPQTAPSANFVDDEIPF